MNTNRLIIITSLFVLCVVFFRTNLIGDYFGTPDVIQSVAVGAPLQKEAIPQYNPYIFSGMPTIGSLQSVDELLYPPNWPFLFVGKITGIKVPGAWYHTVHLIFAALGFITFVQLFIRDKKYIALTVAGAISFAFSLQFLGYLSYGHATKIMTMAYVPWIFWGIEKIRHDRNWKYVAILGLLLGFQLLAAHFQIAYYTWLFAVPYAVITFLREPKTVRNTAYKKVFVGLFSGALLSSVLILPVLEYSAVSIRGSGGVGVAYSGSWSLPPLELLAVIMPNLFGYFDGTYTGWMEFNAFPHFFGIMITLFGIYGAFHGIRSADLRIKTLVGLFIFALIAALGKFTPLHGAMYEYLPFYNKFRVPATFLLFGQFFVSVLAVYGITEAFKKSWGGWTVILPGISFGVLLVLWSGLNVSGWFPENMQGTIGDGALFVAATVVALYLIIRHRFIPAFIAFIVVEILIVAVPLPDPVDIGVRPRDGVVQWLKSRSGDYRVLPLPPWSNSNDWAKDGIEIVTGYHAAKPAEYQQLIEQTKNWSEVNLSTLLHLNVKYIISPSKIESIGLVDSSWVLTNGVRVRAYIHQIPASSRATDKRFQSLQYERTGLGSFRVNTQLDSINVDSVYVSERYYKQWKCKTEDGEELPVRQNGLMMTVVAPSDKPMWLEFYYSSNMFMLGWILSTLAFSSMLGFLFKDRIKKRGKGLLEYSMSKGRDRIYDQN